MIAQTAGFDPAKGFTLASFLNYAVTAGQKRAESLGYARRSNVLVNLALDQIAKIPGAPARPTDLAGAPPPPRPINLPQVGGGAGGAAGGGKPGIGGVAGRPGVGGAAGGGAVSGAPGAAGGTAGGAGSAGGAVVAGAEVNRGADGRVSLNAAALAAGKAASTGKTSSGPSDPISNKDTLWYLLLGAGFVLLGAGVGGGSTAALAKLGKDKS